MKKYASFVFLCLVFFCNKGQAQAPFYNPPANTDAGNPFMRPGQPWSLYIPKTKVEKKSKVHRFKITFRDSTTSIVNGKIDCHGKNYYLAVDDGNVLKSIPARETLLLERLVVDKKLRPGIANDSCWLFVTKGKVNTYSVLTEPEPEFIIAIQKNNGPIVPLTEQNLTAMIEGDAKRTRQLIERNKLQSAVVEYNTIIR